MKRHGEVDIGKAMSYNGTVAAAFPGLAGDVNGGLSAEAIIHAYRTERMANYLKIATFTLAVADFLHTYPGEVRLMWTAPLGPPKILFFSVRYFTLAINTLAVTSSFPNHYTNDGCLAAFKRVAMSSPFLFSAAEAILFYRVWAFSGRTKRMLVYIAIQFITTRAAAFILLQKFLRSLKCPPLPFYNS